jgi:hypothetical protein
MDTRCRVLVCRPEAPVVIAEKRKFFFSFMQKLLLLLMQDVAEFTTTCERYVGTESGGMDQAISMMGMPQIAKLIEFNPVSSAVLPHE